MMHAACKVWQTASITDRAHGLVHAALAHGGFGVRRAALLLACHAAVRPQGSGLCGLVCAVEE
jgi:hypothetical protein